MLEKVDKKNAMYRVVAEKVYRIEGLSPKKEVIRYRPQVRKKVFFFNFWLDVSSDTYFERKDHAVAAINVHNKNNLEKAEVEYYSTSSVEKPRGDNWWI